MLHSLVDSAISCSFIEISLFFVTYNRLFKYIFYFCICCSCFCLSKNELQKIICHVEKVINCIQDDNA